MPLEDRTNITKRKELTDYQLGEISGLLKGGAHNMRAISDILKIPYSTVRDVKNRYIESGTTKPLQKRPGGPSKLRSVI